MRNFFLFLARIENVVNTCLEIHSIGYCCILVLIILIGVIDSSIFPLNISHDRISEHLC